MGTSKDRRDQISVEAISTGAILTEEDMKALEADLTAEDVWAALSDIDDNELLVWMAIPLIFSRRLGLL